MSKELERIISKQIEQHGPMDVGSFMALALGHSEHGYYMKKDPFGAAGDFTTAPEISQMFGEMLGAWVADLWMRMGAPERFILLECGPGRGTLMADLLRATAGVSGFLDSVEVHLLEMSPVLQSLQKEALGGHTVHWHEALESVPVDAPMIVLGNEFLDALPFKQLIYTDQGWRERVIGCEDGGFVYGVRDTGLVPDITEVPSVGDIYEFSPARSGFVEQVGARLKGQGGAALFIDYGHDKSGYGDTFQALYKHEYVSPLSSVGDADLTSHVDFSALSEVVQRLGLSVFGPVHQESFLHHLGIGLRAQALMKGADEKQVKDIETALHRLTHSDQMGTLFKVMGISSDAAIQPAGF